MPEFRCFTCEGSFEADVSDIGNPTAEDFQKLADAMAAHIETHPDSLKVSLEPLPRARDWAGHAKAARGERVRHRG